MPFDLLPFVTLPEQKAAAEEQEEEPIELELLAIPRLQLRLHLAEHQEQLRRSGTLR